MQEATGMAGDIDETRDRPVLPEDYNMPSDKEEMVTWEWVVEQLKSARNYWVCTGQVITASR